MHSEIAAQREYLLKVARMQLGNVEQAEDAVQETLLSALKNVAQFQGQAQLRTWLVSILKNKIMDIFRRNLRAPDSLDSLQEIAGEQVELLFDDSGHWVAPLARFGNPDKILENQQFKNAFALCMQKLPRKNAMAFALREQFGLNIEEICKELAISASNCSVMLFRARILLRACLEHTYLQDVPTRTKGV